MSFVTIQSPDGAEQHCVDELAWNSGASVLDADGNETNPYAGWTLLATGVPLGAASVIVDGAWNNLPEMQSQAWEQVKSLRDQHKAAGVTIPNVGTVQTDDVSTANITGLVVMAQVAIAQSQPFSEPFTMADNTVVTFDAPGMISMGVAVGQYVAAVYARARDLRDQIYAADITEDALAAIDVTTGWP